MRRWFAIFLLVLLPLQFSWAAVAAFCEHESEAQAQAQHLGHHEHQQAGHAGEALDNDAAVTDGLAVVDMDCGHCHTNCCSMPAALGTLALVTLGSRPCPPAVCALSTLVQNPPERPQWVRFA
jgi:ABC-type nickel/cobalt efflux system permease component RcnA